MSWATYGGWARGTTGISSLIMLSGTWECFDNDEFTGTKMAT